MTILADHEITNLCVLPKFKVDERKYHILENQTPVPSIHYPDLETRVQAMTARREKIRAMCQEPLTEEDVATFRPMIDPFLSQSVRETTSPKITVLEPTAPNEMSMTDTIIKGLDTTMSLQVKKNTRRILSKGLTSYGYDISLSNEFKLFSNINSSIIDPKRFDNNCLVDAAVLKNEEGDSYVILPPNSYLLGKTVEYFRMPEDVLGICVGKSTYARAGIAINVTPLEPGWEGNLVVEIANQTNLPAMIYVDEGIAQLLFLRGSSRCTTSYADRKGKYMGQDTIVLPKV